jgi:ethanolamine utilization microcompartment shell protein EutL
VAVEGRFICTKKEVIDQTSVQVVLTASTYGRDNVGWAPYTPAGQVSMVVNGPAGAEFAEGQYYRVLFERVSPDPDYATPPGY